MSENELTFIRCIIRAFICVSLGLFGANMAAYYGINNQYVTAMTGVAIGLAIYRVKK